MAKSKYCGAKLRCGGLCEQLAMPNGRCYFHGGATPAKHPNHRASMNALKHGLRSKKWKEFKDNLKTDLKFADSLTEAALKNKPILISETLKIESNNLSTKTAI